MSENGVLQVLQALNSLNVIQALQVLGLGFRVGSGGKEGEACNFSNCLQKLSCRVGWVVEKAPKYVSV